MKTLEIEQTLHGYLEGHHLLASSIKLSSKSEKIMSVLSDLSGPEIYQGFTEYLTGYPLLEDQYYVIGKTWYAHEMKRPGCVWTHSLLIRFEDLNMVQYCNGFQRIFNKPNIDFDKSMYSKASIVDLSEMKNLSNDLSVNKLEFLISAIFSHNQPIVIASTTSLDLMEEMVFLWRILSNSFLKRYSFCTGALASRKIEDQVFDLQIVPFGLVRNVSRSAKNSIILERRSTDNSSVLWVEDIASQLTMLDTEDFNKFIEFFGPEYYKKSYFKRVAELYIKSDIIKQSASINDLFNDLDYLFSSCDTNIIKSRIIKSLILKENISWFKNRDFTSILVDLCTKINMSNFRFSEIGLESTIEKLWEDSNDDCERIFKRLINETVNELGEYFIRVYANFITPSSLAEFTNLNISACSVLVSANYRLALSIDLWHQTKSFQLEILNCLKDKDISEEKATQIIYTILDNSTVDLSDQLYRVFKDKSISTFLSWTLEICENDRKTTKIKIWFKICKNNPYESLKWLSERDACYDLEFLLLMISVFDPYSLEVTQFGSKPWQNVLHQVDLNAIDDETQVKIAQFLLPIILLTDNEFSITLVDFAYRIIYSKLAKEQFDYEQWEKLEPLLPQLAWYNNWDKCKRLKKAIKAKGYHV